jgi:hypothetical protein
MMNVMLGWAAMSATFFVLAKPAAHAAVSEADARTTARDAYVFGLPMVNTYRVMYAYSVDKGTHASADEER